MSPKNSVRLPVAGMLEFIDDEGKTSKPVVLLEDAERAVAAAGGAKPLDLTDEALAGLASAMSITPWGIGSRRKDAFAFARAAVQLEHSEAAQRLHELSEALDAFDTGGFSEEKVNRINAARKAAREFSVGADSSRSPDVGTSQKVALTEGIWQAIIDWQTAHRALDKRRASGELMNADYLDRVDAAEQRIDALLSAALAPVQAIAATAAKPVITAEMVRKLSGETDESMMRCKKALVDNNGDHEAAKEWLRTAGRNLAAAPATEGLRASERYSFDDMHVGLAQLDNRALATREIPRPPGFKTNAEWYAYAKLICDGLNARVPAQETSSQPAKNGPSL